MSDDDRDLRERFAALRGEESRRAAGFDRVVAHARKRRAPPRAAAFATATFAIALVAVAWIVVSQRPPAPELPMPATWREPTAFLLQTPGRELLSTLPEVGRVVPPSLPESSLKSERSPS